MELGFLKSMNIPPNPHFALTPNREAEFSSLFQEEETPPSTKKEILIPPIIKSLDCIIINLSEAVKTAIYWDDHARKTETDLMEMLKEKSSVMLNIVDYSTPQKEEKRESSRLVLDAPPLLQLEFQNFKPEILKMENPSPYEKITVWEGKKSALILVPLKSGETNFVEINDLAPENLKLIIDPNKKEIENFYDAIQCSNDSHFGGKEEFLCDEIIKNLKSSNDVKHALSLLDDLLEETRKKQRKRPLTPKKIKESLHKLDGVFGLLEKQTKMDCEAAQENRFSDVIKLLESLTDVVKTQLEKAFKRRESEESEGSVGNPTPENLQREIMETFGLLANYSKKAKRLIKEFKTKRKEKKSGSFESYFE